MNWMHQHHDAVKEIHAYYSFIFWVQIRNQFRLLKPRLFFQYTRIVGLFPWKAGLDVPQLRQSMFNLGAALLRRRSRGVQEGLRAAWQELLDPAKAR